VTPAERNYRRVLRLLPAGYRQLWEEDMVGAYMEGASQDGGGATSRRSLSERLSVVALSVRLRLAGGYASPRGLAWRGAVRGFALVALLYLGLSAVVAVTGQVTPLVRGQVWFHPATPLARYEAHFFYFSPVFDLLWAVAFCCLVLGRATATRTLALFALATQVGVAIAEYSISIATGGGFGAEITGDMLRLLGGDGGLRQYADWAWLVTITAATLVAASAGPARPRRAWLGGAALLGAVLAAAQAMATAPSWPRWPDLYVNLGILLHLGLALAMVLALAIGCNPRWLLPLACFSAVFAGRQLVGYLQYVATAHAIGQVGVSPISFWQQFAIGLLALAVVCAMVGLIRLWRLPRRADRPEPDPQSAGRVDDGGGSAGNQPPRSDDSRRDPGLNRPSRQKKPLWVKLVIVFSALVILGGGLTVAVPKLVAYWAVDHVSQKNVNGAINFLLVASDTPDPTANPIDAISPIQSDSMMLMHIPADHSKVYMISLPRDLPVDIPTDPRTGIAEHTDRLNAAFAQAAADTTGPDAASARYGNGAVFLMKTIANNIPGGLKFNGWATLNFDGFDKVVQALGSVYMCFDEDVYSIHYWADSTPSVPHQADGSLYDYATATGDYTRGYHYPKGQCRDLQPWEALDYSRQSVGLPGGDYDRQRHQQQLLKAIVKETLSSDTLTNLDTIKNLEAAAGDLLTLDLGGNKLDDWVYTLKNLRASDMVMVQTYAGQFASATDAQGNYLGESFQPSLKELLQDVQKDDVVDFLAQHPDWVAKDAP
jgi:anionic cell wall polymer biosynthesis LytR-Cps2A-Psr (LCP) family protein